MAIERFRMWTLLGNRNTAASRLLKPIRRLLNATVRANSALCAGTAGMSRCSIDRGRPGPRIAANR